MNDSTLEREIEALLAAEPSADFRARLRQRIAQEPPLEPPAFRWRLAWALVASAVVAATTMLMLTIPRVERAPTPRPELRARAAEIPRANAITPVIVGRRPTRTVPRPAGRHQPEVIVDASEALALRRLLSGGRNGQIELARARAEDQSPTATSEEFSLPPIVIELLTSLNEEGVQP